MSAVITKNNAGDTVILNSDQVQMVILKNGKGHVYFAGEEAPIEIPETDVPKLREAWDKVD